MLDTALDPENLKMNSTQFLPCSLSVFGGVQSAMRERKKG